MSKVKTTLLPIIIIFCMQLSQPLKYFQDVVNELIIKIALRIAKLLLIHNKKYSYKRFCSK